MKEPSLGMIEYKSVAVGITACDAMVKKAPIRIIETHPVCPGKYITIICGEVADVEEALKAGLETGKDSIIADLFLPHIHPTVIPALAGTTQIETFQALGIIETFSAALCIKAADIAAKTTPIQLVEIRLCNGLGGKGYFIFTGPLTDTEASFEEAKMYLQNEGQLTACQLIPSPHPELIEKGIYW